MRMKLLINCYQFVVLFFTKIVTSRNAKITTTARNSTPITSKPFIYLVQTEQCLPQQWASSARIGDSKTCNCDVIVLSYKEECQDEKPAHISYVFAKESTWATGRNLLYFVAIERIRHYHYYIFLDDDVDLEFNSFSSQQIKRLTPLRAFEQWLLEDEPAVGVGNCNGSAETLLTRRGWICGVKESSVVLPVVWFDALFNAFHHKAHFALSYTIWQRELVDFSVTCNLFCRADIPRPGTKVCTYYSLQHATSSLSSGDQDVFRANTCHYRKHSKQGTCGLPKPHLV